MGRFERDLGNGIGGISDGLNVGEGSKGKGNIKADSQISHLCNLDRRGAIYLQKQRELEQGWGRKE